MGEEKLTFSFPFAHGTGARSSCTPSQSEGQRNEASGRDEKRAEVEDEDPDIQVLSQSIISPRNNPYQINSLELETRNSIYRARTWLENR
jgi:hypothetical protein